jgi:small-conductance mechanosensitive channel
MDWNFGEVLLWTLWFTVWMMAIWLVIAIVMDIFRDRALSGWGKAAWTIFVLVVPWLGALVYLIARGRSMNERSMAIAKEQDEAMRAYVRSAAGTPSTADELGKLADLHQRGVLSQTEYEQAKAAVLGGAAPVPGLQGSTKLTT